jgi:hypothetical protein
MEEQTLSIEPTFISEPIDLDRLVELTAAAFERYFAAVVDFPPDLRMYRDVPEDEEQTR